MAGSFWRSYRASCATWNDFPTVSVNVYYHVGSGREKPGRTGFAHLFEHIMFEGSGHVPEGAFDNWLEAAGASNNGSTNPDRTNYYEDMPSNALELALYGSGSAKALLLRGRTERDPHEEAWRVYFEDLDEGAERDLRALRSACAADGGGFLIAEILEREAR